MNSLTSLSGKGSNDQEDGHWNSKKYQLTGSAHQQMSEQPRRQCKWKEQDSQQSLQAIGGRRNLRFQENLELLGGDTGQQDREKEHSQRVTVKFSLKTPVNRVARSPQV